MHIAQPTVDDLTKTVIDIDGDCHVRLTVSDSDNHRGGRRLLNALDRHNERPSPSSSDRRDSEPSLVDHSQRPFYIGRLGLTASRGPSSLAAYRLFQRYF